MALIFLLLLFPFFGFLYSKSHTHNNNNNNTTTDCCRMVDYTTPPLNLRCCCVALKCLNKWNTPRCFYLHALYVDWVREQWAIAKVEKKARLSRMCFPFLLLVRIQTDSLISPLNYKYIIKRRGALDLIKKKEMSDKCLYLETCLFLDMCKVSSLFTPWEEIEK